MDATTPIAAVTSAVTELVPATVVAIASLSHFYGRGALRNQILFDINLELKAGEIVILTGPSGSGKTTLLTLIGGLRSAQTGHLEVLGQQLVGASKSGLVQVRRGIGYIFQAHNLLEYLTARQNVRLSLDLHGTPAAAADRQATEMLDAVGLSDRLDYYPAQLSGGQKQRVAVARALACHPQLVLADEPTASLDSKSGRAIVEIMESLAKKQGSTILLVAHDRRILDVADRTISLEDGRLTAA
ncbi:MAG: ATP-binding cassette domain-containing protein [Cyanobacteria bacterium J06641_5]